MGQFDGRLAEAVDEPAQSFRGDEHIADLPIQIGAGGLGYPFQIHLPDQPEILVVADRQVLQADMIDRPLGLCRERYRIREIPQRGNKSRNIPQANLRGRNVQADRRLQ